MNYRVLSSSFHHVILFPGFIGFYWVVMGFTGLYCVLLGLITGFYWVYLFLRGCTGFYLGNIVGNKVNDKVVVLELTIPDGGCSVCRSPSGWNSCR